jgi:hypothetical protein
MALRSLTGSGADTLVRECRQRHPIAQGYNTLVPNPPTPEKSLEASGVVIVALLVLIIIVVRYWHQIPWSAR